MDIDLSKLNRIIETSPQMEAYAFGKCDELIERAKAVFIAQADPDNRTSETSPPRYLASFEKSREGLTFYAENVDPGATMVEFGAHAGGETPVLKYSPLRKALDEMVIEDG